MSTNSEHIPDPTVVTWLREGLIWEGEEPAATLYAEYLSWVTGRPVSRERFIADLAYLGVRDVTPPGGTPTLLRE
ncbi:hypothetical protein [Spirilliplanes yamanashiensis]|uniref:Uncharacterized protein n=1 Tax=Spirilliplanes yamanashiensis TaxID=42233 RepID=A0A8J3YDP7_9ACTN|nr:hypothetical protein [Spirilliplanes yamanashiensis]MDP9816272.1 hypothetical protein [Spirilliplanes yamanashiensis]GIJ05798.1 hypothetical protein Sya03_51500 [Spirilliplanes yamanashiensis]